MEVDYEILVIVLYGGGSWDIDNSVFAIGVGDEGLMLWVLNFLFKINKMESSKV